jgi:MinD-like ATPase involved in chromosome partitioning or flagellar assembly
MTTRSLHERARGMDRDGRRMVVVAGSKGGVGCSVTAVLLAAAAAEHGHATLLVEACGAAGPLHLLLGVGGQSESADDTTTLLAPNLSLARVPHGLGWAERRLRFRRVMTHTEEMTRVVVDAGSRVDDVIALCHTAARVLVITQRDRVSLAAAYALCKAIWFAAPSLDIGIVVNGAAQEEADVAAEIVRSAALHFIGREVPLTGALPHDAEFSARVESGAALDALCNTEIGDAARLVAHNAFAAPAEARPSTHLRIRNG